MWQISDPPPNGASWGNYFWVKNKTVSANAAKFQCLVLNGKSSVFEWFCPFETGSSKCSVFKWIQYSNVRNSSPY